MSLSTQDPTLAKTRFFHAVGVQSQASQMQLGKSFFSWLMTTGGKPDLQVVEFDSPTADVVIADAPCQIFAIILNKLTATAATFKGSDHASVQAASTQIIAVTENEITCDSVFYPKGNACALGFTISSDTTPDGTTDSAAGDGAAGVVLLGKP
jgi:hypothetical protein